MKMNIINISTYPTFILIFIIILISNIHVSTASGNEITYTEDIFELMTVSICGMC